MCNKELIVIKLPLEKYDYEETQNIVNMVKTTFPNQDILLMFKDIDLKFMKIKNPYTYTYGDREF